MGQIMSSTQTILKLVDQAANAGKTLDPTDPSAIEALQEMLDQIVSQIEQDDCRPSEILDQVKEQTTDADQLLRKMLENKVSDAEQANQTISNVISALHGLIEQSSESQHDAALKEPAEQAPHAPTQPNQNPAEQTPTDNPKENRTDEKAESSEEAAQPMPVDEDDIPLLLDFITESNEHIESAEAGLLELEDRPRDTEVLNQIFRAFHTIKGMAGFLNLTQIGSLAHSAENLLDMARKGELVLTGNNTDLVFASIDTIKKMMATLAEAIEAGEPVPSQPGLDTLLDKLKAAAEGATEQPLTRQDDEQMDKLLGRQQSQGSFESSASSIKSKTKSFSGDEKIKVSTKRLDNLINMAGELVIAQLMVTEQITGTLAGEHELIRKTTHQSKIVRELQELSMAMRMVPIRGVFQKMARLVRDLSHKFDKKINFVTSGDDTELDRSIVDKIADPLVHMVRNSLDHGIEPADQRAKAGKSPTGTLELRAFHQAGNIVIEIEDDGKGLDRQKILKKAVDQGIVEPDQELPDEEIFKLIFHAGLSTAKEITSVSGRGVGMDVVKKNIEALRGRIDVASTPGKGSVFTIRMPLTLAIIDGQVIKIGSERYIIPINSIVKSLKPTAQQLSSVSGRAEMINVRGDLIPLVRLYKLFRIAPTTEDPTEALIVVVEEDGRKCGLLVDELLGQQQVVIKNLGEGLGAVAGISGGAIMGDGKISLILDVPGLIQLSQN